MKLEQSQRRLGNRLESPLPSEDGAPRGKGAFSKREPSSLGSQGHTLNVPTAAASLKRTPSRTRHGRRQHHGCRTSGSLGESGPGEPGLARVPRLCISPRPLRACGWGTSGVHEGWGRPGVCLPKRLHHRQNGTWRAERGAQRGRHCHSDGPVPGSNAGTG
jgi:hypothetical protein